MASGGMHYFRTFGHAGRAFGRRAYPQQVNSQVRRHFAQRFNYNRFQATKGLLNRWAQSPTFYYQVAGIGGAGGVFYISNLEEVPVWTLREAAAQELLS